MASARMSTLASLRGEISRLETETVAQDAQRMALGHAGADEVLQGGLMRGVLHEVFALETRQSAAATGFVAGIAERLAKRRPLLWVRQDFVETEAGVLSMSGLAELGLDPRRLVMVHAADAEVAVARSGRRTGLRCARRRGARSVGRGTCIRSRRQPQADFNRANLRRALCDAAHLGVAGREHGGDTLGSCARRARRPRRHGASGARRCSTRNLFVTVTARPASGSWNGIVMSAFSVNRRRILSLRLPRLPTDRIRRQLLRRAASQAASAAPDDDMFHRPWVVAGKLNNALQITALDDAAATIGLEIGLPLANARAICPELQVFDHDEAANAQVLSHIADWCDRFTPLVALDPPDGLLLDISGCAHLFGGEAAMLRTVSSALRHQGFAVSAAIAGTPACARTVAYAANNRIVPAGGEAEAVSPLPVSALGVDEAITRGLRRAGLKTIGDVASRAPHEITARFGASFTVVLQEALGRGDAPISPRKSLPDFMAERRFAEPVATQDVIVAALSHLAHMLVFAMERHGKGARLLEANFFRTDGVVRTITVETGQPVTRAHVADRLFRERLDALADPLDPGFGFDLIRLSARRVDVVVQAQRDFDTRAQDNDDVAALIDRIAARIGGRRVVVHLPQDTHSPEKAVRAVPAQHHLPDAVQAVWPERYAGEPLLRPLRMFEPPEKIDVTAMFPDGRPGQFTWRKAQHGIANVEGPERIAMEWWTRPAHLQDSNDTRTRDYFRIEDQEGCRFWLYREGIYQREVKTFRWFLQGVFA